MTNSSNEIGFPLAMSVAVDDAALTVELVDGRTVSVPIAWYPRLLHATRKERSHWRFIGEGDGIHWPDLDEDISVAAMLAGRKSGESPRSLQKWLDARASRRTRQRKSA